LLPQLIQTASNRQGIDPRASDANVSSAAAVRLLPTPGT
jgi:hypothetical protein